MVLIYKVLEQGVRRAIRPLEGSRVRLTASPKVQDGVMRLSRARYEALFEGLDGRRVIAQRVQAPAAAG